MTIPQYDNDDLFYDDTPYEPYPDSIVYDISRTAFKNLRKNEETGETDWYD